MDRSESCLRRAPFFLERAAPRRYDPDRGFERGDRKNASAPVTPSAAWEGYGRGGRPMNTVSPPDTEELIELTARGDAEARGQLLVRHSKKLLKMVAVRLDRGVAA